MPDWKPEFLVSYWFVSMDKPLQAWLQEEQGRYDVMLDSGAFTVMSYLRKGKDPPRPTITLDEYCDYLDEWRHLYWQYVALDVVGDPVATAANLDIMVERGLSPMPVLVVNESEEATAPMMAVNDHVCLAGAVAFSPEYMTQRFQRVMKHTQGRAKIHALGLCRAPLVYQVPLNSVDSSSGHSGRMWGELNFYNPKTGSMEACGKIQHMRDRDRIVRSLRRFGVQPQHYDRPKLWGGAMSIPHIVTCFAYLSMARHAKALGLRAFQACPSLETLRHTLWIAQYVTASGRADLFKIRREFFEWKAAGFPMDWIEK